MDRFTGAAVSAVLVRGANVVACGERSCVTGVVAAVDGVSDDSCRVVGGVGRLRAGGAVSPSVNEGVPEEFSAPPELRTTTPVAADVVWVTSVGEDPADVVGVDAVADDGLTVLPEIVEDGDVNPVAASVDDAALAVEPVEPVDPAELVAPLLSVPVSPVADATPGLVATAIPTPNATANAPTRPIYIA